MDTEQLHKDIRSLQIKISDLGNQYGRLVREQIPSREFEIRRAQLTHTELASYPPTTPMYKTVGRAYFKSPQDGLLASIQEVQKEGHGRISKLNEQRAALEKAINGLEHQLTGLTQAAQKLQQSS